MSLLIWRSGKKINKNEVEHLSSSPSHSKVIVHHVGIEASFKELFVSSHKFCHESFQVINRFGAQIHAMIEGGRIFGHRRLQLSVTIADQLLQQPAENDSGRDTVTKQFVESASDVKQ